jgi:hypothetical protein
MLVNDVLILAVIVPASNPNETLFKLEKVNEAERLEVVPAEILMLP